MSNLIKAEWYRIRHSSNLFMWMIFICIIVAMIPMISDLECLKKTLSENLEAYKESGIFFVPLFTAMVISIGIGLGYNNKTSYYEIMDGHKTMDIILSKLIVNTAVMTGGIIIFCSIYFTIIYVMNGVGQYDNIIVTLILFILIIMHICALSVLLSMCVRHLAGAVLVFLKFNIFDTIFVVLFFKINGNSNKYLYWFIGGQFQKVATGEVSNNLIIGIILSTIIECVILYAISYYTMKKRKNLL